jgi:uncharacterized protein YneF (UPF0154 family)
MLFAILKEKALINTYTKMETKKNIALPLTLLAVGILVGFLIGYFVANKSAPRAAQNAELQNLVNVAFPKPPDDLRTVNARILKIDGARIEFETPDPEDYLPHSDNSPQAMMTRVGRVTSETTLKRIDTGASKETKISLSELKTGDTVTLTATENVRTA